MLPKVRLRENYPRAERNMQHMFKFISSKSQ